MTCTSFNASESLAITASLDCSARRHEERKERSDIFCGTFIDLFLRVGSHPVSYFTIFIDRQTSRACKVMLCSCPILPADVYLAQDEKRSVRKGYPQTTSAGVALGKNCAKRVLRSGSGLPFGFPFPSFHSHPNIAELLFGVGIIGYQPYRF